MTQNIYSKIAFLRPPAAEAISENKVGLVVY